MNINDLELDFNKNISIIINEKLRELKKYTATLRSIKMPDYKVTTSSLLSEIYDLFGDDCICDRTLSNIKSGARSSSTFNICIIIYTLNSLIEEINNKLDKQHAFNCSRISKICLDSLLISLKG